MWVGQMLAQLESIAQGIFSVVATLGRFRLQANECWDLFAVCRVPVIRAQPGNAAAMVADMIDKMLRQVSCAADCSSCSCVSLCSRTSAVVVCIQSISILASRLAV